MSSPSSSSSPDTITIAILGAANTGKSSLTLRIAHGIWRHAYDATIEDHYSITRLVDGHSFSLSLTDTAGQEAYRCMSSAANVQADAFLLVYDITQRGSLAALQGWAGTLAGEFERRRKSAAVWPGVMVVGNKCDLGREREVSAVEGLEWARRCGYGFMETSAKECVNVEETFSSLVRRVVEARRLFAAGYEGPVSDASLSRSPGVVSEAWSTEKEVLAIPVQGKRVSDGPKRRRGWSKIMCC